MKPHYRYHDGRFVQVKPPLRAITRSEVSAALRLAAAIKVSGKTQQAIAGEVGVSQGAIWQWVHAKMRVPADRALALARALGVKDPGELSPHWAETIGDLRPDLVAAMEAAGYARTSDKEAA